MQQDVRAQLENAYDRGNFAAIRTLLKRHNDLELKGDEAETDEFMRRIHETLMFDRALIGVALVMATIWISAFVGVL